MACAALGFSTPALSTAAAAAVLSGLQQSQAKQFRPKQVAHAVFALAKLQACDQQLLDATAAAFWREPQAYSPPLLSMLVWVCLLARQQVPAGFVQELVQCSRDKLDQFSGDQVRPHALTLLASVAYFAPWMCESLVLVGFAASYACSTTSWHSICNTVYWRHSEVRLLAGSPERQCERQQC